MKKLLLVFGLTMLMGAVFAQVSVKTVIHDDGTNELTLRPHSQYDGIIDSSRVIKADKNFPFIYEGYYRVSKEDLKKSGKGTSSKIDINDISRVVRSVSNMEGMLYYSSSKNKQVVLYEKAYMVDGENSKKKIPDQNTGNADGQTSYCYQKDNSFSDIFYKLNYYQKDNTMLAVFTTTSWIGIGPIKAIAPGNLKIFIYVEEHADDIVLYLCTDLDSAKFPGIKTQLNDSMTSRMDAVYEWFMKQF